VQKSKKGKKPMDKQHITCFGCRKKGHYCSECLENENDKDEEMDAANLTLNCQGIDLMVAALMIDLPSMTWIANLGTSMMHITNEECGLYEKRCVNEPISLSNGKIICTTILGKLDITVSQARH